jgi:protease-4
MKTFFKMLLASILGVIISVLLIFFILLGIATALISSGDNVVEIEPNSILKITLDNEIFDREPNNPFAGINFAGIGKEKQDGLIEILDNIKKARNDENIKGIYLEFSLIQARMATIEEIRNALLDFKKSGKFIIAYAEVYTQGSYYLASVADKIYLNPQGSIDFVGLRTEMMFFKGTLDKLGVEAQIIRHGKFKSAVEPFMGDKMSQENKLQVTEFINSIWAHYLSGISEQRHITKDKLNILANKMVLADADTCLAYKIVDSLFYKDQVNAKLLKLSGQKNKEPEFIGLSKFGKVPKKPSGKGLAKAKIAVIFAQGDVVMGNEGENFISSDRISKAFRDARNDSSVKAVVFRINSPGGSSLASDIIWREVKLTTKVKPVIASMGDLAASGGYYIACAADVIVASPNTITGSIGVFGLLINVKQFFNQKLGITTDVARTNEHSDFPTIMRPMNTAEKAIMQFEVDKIYNIFIEKVAEGRKLDKKKVDEIAQGRVWTGSDAIGLGLVDTIGGLNDAIAIAAKKVKIDNYRLIELPKLEDTFEKIIGEITGDAKIKILKSELGADYKYIQQYRNLMRMKGIQARLPYDVDVY